MTANMSNMFAVRLREVREERGLGVRGAAEAADVGYSTFSRVENGGIPSVTALRKLCLWSKLDMTWAACALDGLHMTEPTVHRHAYLLEYLDDWGISLFKEADAGWTATLYHGDDSHPKWGEPQFQQTGVSAMDALESLIEYINEASND